MLEATVDARASDREVTIAMAQAWRDYVQSQRRVPHACVVIEASGLKVPDSFAELTALRAQYANRVVGKIGNIESEPDVVIVNE